MIQQKAMSEEARDVALKLVSARERGTTVCPSEIARVLAATRAGSAKAVWRSEMPMVHAAVDRLLAEGLIKLSWKGKPLATREGPYRIEYIA